jgi:hypothetical protein
MTWKQHSKLEWIILLVLIVLDRYVSGFIIVYKMRNFLNLLYFKTQQFASKYRIQNILSTTQLAQLIEITLKQRHILTFAVLFDN